MLCREAERGRKRGKGDSNPTAQAAAVGDALSASCTAALCAQSPPPPPHSWRTPFPACPQAFSLCTQRWYRFTRIDRHMEKGLICQRSQFNDVLAKVLQLPRPQEQQPALLGSLDLSLGERQRACSVECRFGRSGHSSPRDGRFPCALRLVL